MLFIMIVMDLLMEIYCLLSAIVYGSWRVQQYCLWLNLSYYCLRIYVQ